MKKTRRIVLILLVIILMLGGLSVVNAAENQKFASGYIATENLTISNGVRNGNVVTYTITLPASEGGLRGDANNNGRVDEYKDYDAVDEDGVKRPELKDYNVDAYLITGYCAMINKADELNMLLADYDLSGDVNIADVTTMLQDTELLKNPITLEGSLAKDSTYKMSKNSNGTYKVEVTIPTDKSGTIGITVKTGVFKHSKTEVYDEQSSTVLSVESYDSSIKINDGIKEGNKVTFKIDAPKGTGLKGDINNDGKVDVEDIKILQDFLVGKDTTGEFNNTLADCYTDGKLDTFDMVILKRIVTKNSDDDKTNDSIVLNGTLAKDSTYELVKDADGSYKIVVTIPENATTGTIAVKLQESVMKTTNVKVNKEISSNEFDLSKKDDSNKFKVVDEKQENTSDGKVKVTITVNKELDKDNLPSGWDLSEDGKTISKVMEDGKKEELTLVSKDGEKIKYNVNAELLKVVEQKGEDAGNGKIKVTITVNKELDKNQIPEGWTLSEDGKTISKVMNKDEEFKVTLVAKDGSKLEYSGVAKITNGDKTTATGKIPQTGVGNTIIFVVVDIAIIGTVVFVKSRKMLK